jgi:single-stranded-DNA-specific exonuclease
MPRNWTEPQPVSVPRGLTDAVGGHHIVSQTLYQRGYRDIDTIRGFLDPTCYQSTSPSELPDVNTAVDLIGQAINTSQRICVWGDFDVDGQTATTLLVTALRCLGGDVIYHIPVRARESHGISPTTLLEILSHGVDLLLTCDTGVTSHQAVQLAHSHNVPVIITDHHDLPAELPEAKAVINPKLLPPEHYLSKLPGVGVAFKLVEALYQQYNCSQPLSDLLDLVALGIVADLAVLQAETRFLLQLGLQVLHHTPRIGLQILSELADLNLQYITEDHISFILAPRLNALGRLSDANSIVEFFTTANPLRARLLAYELEGLNANRKVLSDQVYKAALAQLERDTSLLHSNCIVLAHPAWPAGVIGIAAARLAEQFGKPAILFTMPPGEPARGSARSIEGINISAAISSQAHLLENFGGHPMAAGLSIQSERIAEFRRSISQTIASELQNVVKANLIIDGYLDLNSLTLDLVTEIERLAPFGTGNPPVVLATRDLSLSGYSSIGKHGEHLLMTIEDSFGQTQKAIWWQGAGQSIPDNRFDLAFTARATTYRGQKEVQLEWIDFRPLVESHISSPTSVGQIIVEDFRHLNEPLPILNNIRANHNVLIWCENEDKPVLHAMDRLQLQKCTHLVIWSSPPGHAILRQAIQEASPMVVYLFGNSTSMDQAQPFLKRLAGLYKYAINHDAGKIHLSILAAATNQRIETVKAGLRWLSAVGHIPIADLERDPIQITTGTGLSGSRESFIIAELQALLAESAAFRQYYLRADKDQLINPGTTRPKD